MRRLFAAVGLLSLMAAATPSNAQTVDVFQGDDWTWQTREAFYAQDQGSRIMPAAWMRALRLPNGDGFLADGLTRYGYLVNPQAPAPGVPVGFTIASDVGGPSIGMTCAACHTRQIDVSGTGYRIDGGPAIVDFQSFLKDLNDAVAAVLADADAFDAFAAAVLGAAAADGDKATLRADLELWHLRFDTLIARSLPDPAWGPSRLDAVTMIFNRLTGLDIGEPPSYLIPDNIARADAPVRYPFLWNAAIQDKTQWLGFADNGSDILGLSRNLGEVYGVFAVFHPKKQSGFFNRDYLTNNSANFAGLEALEGLVRKIGAPRWPWQIDRRLAAQGAEIYLRDAADGGCAGCHGIKPGAVRPVFNQTWATPIMDVGTDSRQCAILKRTVRTGVMEGASIPLIGTTLKPTDTGFNVLAVSVIGSIAQNKLSLTTTAGPEAMIALEQPASPELESLKGAFRTPEPVAPEALLQSVAPMQAPSGCAYESRVLEGIWATAPYLHNGSVRSLADLLEPSADRAATFPLGPAYDIATVGLAAQQTAFGYVLETTDCAAVDSGNSRCGHEFGTALPEAEKAALLEYLKSL